MRCPADEEGDAGKEDQRGSTITCMEKPDNKDSVLLEEGS